jgi:DNA polymerase-3 subunit delta'
VQPEDSKQIKIDQIRTLIRWVGQTSSRSGLKIAIVSPAEQMNHQSANALLKCLEEPASNTLIFLVTANPGSLLPTIRSRCQQYLFPIPNREVALRWLKEQAADLENPSMKLEISGGAPLAVLHQFDKEYFQRRTQITAAIRQVLGAAGNPVESASMVQKHEADDVLQTIISILSDCLKYKLSSDERFIKNQDVMAEVVSIADACSAGFLFAALDRVRADLKIAKSTSNPNKALLLESLMIDLFGKHKGSLVEYNL